VLCHKLSTLFQKRLGWGFTKFFHLPILYSWLLRVIGIVHHGSRKRTKQFATSLNIYDNTLLCKYLVNWPTTSKALVSILHFVINQCLCFMTNKTHWREVNIPLKQCRLGIHLCDLARFVAFVLLLACWVIISKFLYQFFLWIVFLGVSTLIILYIQFLLHQFYSICINEIQINWLKH
jgi:hypothetical protein